LLVIIGPVLGKIGRDDLIPAIRFLSPVQLSWAVAAGVGAHWATRWLWRRSGARLGRIRRHAQGAAAVGVYAVALFLILPGAKARANARVQTMEQQHPGERAQLEVMIQKLKTMRPGRVYASAELGTGSHWWMYLPFVYAGKPALRAYGGAALQSSPSFVYLREFNPRTQWDLYNVRYVLLRGRVRREGGPQSWGESGHRRGLWRRRGNSLCWSYRRRATLWPSTWP